MTTKGKKYHHSEETKKKISASKIIDMSYRKCSVCGVNKTAMVKTKGVGQRPNWYIDKEHEGLFKCKTCYMRELKQKKL
jgi:hypothetical protein